MQNCIWTIMDVHDTVSDEYENGEFLSQFEDLEQGIQDLDMSHISEVEVLMVEQATNDLLVEYQSIFEAGDFGPVYELQEN